MRYYDGYYFENLEEGEKTHVSAPNPNEKAIFIAYVD